MLALDRVGKTYPNGVNALERFSADIRLGEIVAIIGGSGCGKSTLLRAIAGLDPATTGSVTLDDIKISAPHEKIGIIFQEPRLLPWLSVADNIGFGLSNLPAGLRRSHTDALHDADDPERAGRGRHCSSGAQLPAVGRRRAGGAREEGGQGRRRGRAILGDEGAARRDRARRRRSRLVGAGPPELDDRHALVRRRER